MRVLNLGSAAAYLGALSGRRRAAAAIGLGVAGAGILPPLYLFPLGFAAFVGLLWMIEGARVRSAFWIGWLFGLGHFAAGLYWIANALMIEWWRVGWMIPFAVLGLGAVLGVFVGAATACVRAAKLPAAAAPFGLALFWMLAEVARGHVLTGFPWNLVATAWLASDALAQSAALFGAYALSGVGVLVFALPASLARGNWRPAAASAAILAVAWGAGAYRLAQSDAGLLPDIRLRIVQPNVPQALKWDPEARERNLEELIALTRSDGFADATHVIWSETATAFPIWGDTPALAARRAQVAEAVPPGGMLVTGAPRFARDADGIIYAWNSLHAMAPDGTLTATFDKFHLVPFGEYVPLREWLPFERIVPGGIDFSAGPGPQLLAVRGLPIASPLICYEIIFPGNVVPAGPRPDLLLNVTNDSWFGQSSGPHQHFAATRLRAVEEGLPAIRAAGGGISAVIDGYGRPVAKLGLGARGVLDSGLPASLAATPYARARSAPIFVLAVLLGALAGWLRRYNVAT